MEAHRKLKAGELTAYGWPVVLTEAVNLGRLNTLNRALSSSRVRELRFTANAHRERSQVGDAHGVVALWIGVGTESYFANLTIKQ